MTTGTLKRGRRTGAATATRTRKKAATTRRTSGKTGHTSFTTPEERRRMIAEAAYFRAEDREFSDPERDWYEAEAEIDAILAKEK